MKKETIQERIYNVKSTWGVVMYVWTREKNGKLYILLKLFLAIINSLVNVFFVFLPGELINELTKRNNNNKIIVLVSCIVLTPLFIYCIKKIIDYKLTTIVSEFNNNSMKIMYQRIADMDFEEIEKPEIEQLKSRALNSMARVLSIVDIYCGLISTAIQFMLIVSVVSTLNIGIVILVVICIVINFIFSKWLVKKARESKLEADILNRKKTTFEYIFSEKWFAKEIRLFNSKDYLITKMQNNEKEINQHDLRYKKKEYWVNIIPVTTKFLQQIVVYIYLVCLVLKNIISIGTMTIYLSSVEQLSNSLNGLSKSFLSIIKLEYSWNDITDFFSIPLRQISTGSKHPVFDENSTIVFKNVSFKYPGSERYVLKDLNLQIYGSEKLCIVGENGAGKSTFIKLLTRLYYPTEGVILLNGINIYEYDYYEYIKLFAPVFQDFCRYSLEVVDNICLCSDINEKKLNKAIRDVGLAELIEVLPKKMNTQVGKWIDKNGFEPSGGEGQRIAIARACYHGGKIFLLDEPTAALDPMAEYEIYTQFNNIITDKCAVLITHRLSAVQLVDKIAVFDDGKVVEYGTHEELYRQDGIYREMFDKQAQFYRKSSNEKK